MATPYNKIALIAAVLVVVSFLGPQFFSSTGAATATNTRDFSIKTIIYPKTILTDKPTTTKAIIVNKGDLPATFVYYEYRVWNEQGGEIFRTGDKAYIKDVPVGQSTRSISSVYFPKAGKYKVKVTLDVDPKGQKNGNFAETDETNNIYETTVTVV